MTTWDCLCLGHRGVLVLHAVPCCSVPHLDPVAHTPIEHLGPLTGREFDAALARLLGCVPRYQVYEQRYECYCDRGAHRDPASIHGALPRYEQDPLSLITPEGVLLHLGYSVRVESPVNGQEWTAIWTPPDADADVVGWSAGTEYAARAHAAYLALVDLARRRPDNSYDWQPGPMPPHVRWPSPPHFGGLPTASEVHAAADAARAAGVFHYEGCVRPAYHPGACELVDGSWRRRREESRP